MFFGCSIIGLQSSELNELATLIKMTGDQSTVKHKEIEDSPFPITDIVLKNPCKEVDKRVFELAATRLFDSLTNRCLNQHKLYLRDLKNFLSDPEKTYEKRYTAIKNKYTGDCIREYHDFVDSRLMTPEMHGESYSKLVSVIQVVSKKFVEILLLQNKKKQDQQFDNLLDPDKKTQKMLDANIEEQTSSLQRIAKEILSTVQNEAAIIFKIATKTKKLPCQVRPEEIQQERAKIIKAAKEREYLKHFEESQTGRAAQKSVAHGKKKYGKSKRKHGYAPKHARDIPLRDEESKETKFSSREASRVEMASSNIDKQSQPPHQSALSPIQEHLHSIKKRKSAFIVHPRVQRWDALNREWNKSSMEEMRQFRDYFTDEEGVIQSRYPYAELDPKSLKKQHAFHMLEGIELLLSDETDRDIYSFETERGRGVIACLTYQEENEVSGEDDKEIETWGPIYFGLDGNNEFHRKLDEKPITNLLEAFRDTSSPIHLLNRVQVPEKEAAAVEEKDVLDQIPVKAKETPIVEEEKPVERVEAIKEQAAAAQENWKKKKKKRNKIKRYEFDLLPGGVLLIKYPRLNSSVKIIPLRPELIPPQLLADAEIIKSFK